MAAIVVSARHFRFVHGKALITTYEAPIVEHPPAYQTAFCSRCGSVVPNTLPGSDWIEIPAGLLDSDPKVRPERHIYIEHKAPWYEISDDLPRLSKPLVQELRAKNRK